MAGDKGTYYQFSIAEPVLDEARVGGIVRQSILDAIDNYDWRSFTPAPPPKDRELCPVCGAYWKCEHEVSTYGD